LAPAPIAWTCGGTLLALVAALLSPRTFSPRQAEPTQADRDQPLASLRRNARRLTKPIWYLPIGTIGVLLIFSAIALDDMYGPTGNGNVLNLHTVTTVLAELGFALLISFAIAITVERQARNRDSAAHEAMRKRIAQDVFQGVFSEHLPRNYISAVIRQNLQTNIIRRDVRIIENMSLDNHERYNDVSDILNRTLRCEREIRFTLSNLSDREIMEIGRLFVPILDEGFIQDTRLNSLVLDGYVIDKSLLDEYRQVDFEGGSVNYAWPIPIGPSRSVEIEIKTTHFKNSRDTEILSSLYPTLGLELIFRSSAPLTHLGFRARTAHEVSSAYSDAGKGIGTWRIEGPMLPNESITYWWAVKK
jgi:hypothetical protein